MKIDPKINFKGLRVELLAFENKIENNTYIHHIYRLYRLYRLG